MVLKSGYLTIGRVRRAPIRLHWSLPIGMIAFTGFRLAPGAWLGFVLLILVHELGHAAAVAYARQRIVAVDVLGFGGLCRWEGYPTPRQRVLIAWGGVLAQAALGLATLAAGMLVGLPRFGFAGELVATFLGTNLGLILFNLLPMPPLDGAEAWGVIHLFAAARARRRAEAERARVAAEKARAKEAAQRETKSLDEVDGRELPPMPDEVRRVLDRIMAEGRAQHEAEKKK
jgi:Zn-dependent protease